MIPGFARNWLLKEALKTALKKLDEGGHMTAIKAFFGGSKKATAVVVGIVTVLLRELLGLDEATVNTVIQLIMTYLLGQGAVDAAMALKGNKR